MKILYTFFFLLLIYGCDKQEIENWESNERMIQFQASEKSYSFKLSDKENDVIDIPVSINGLKVDQESTFKCEVLLDSTTMPADYYEIIDTKIEKNKTEGVVKLSIKKFGDIESDDTRIWLRLHTNENFLSGPYRYQDCEVSITNKLLPPITWGPGNWMAKYELGNYSSNYYAIIIEATGYTNFIWHKSWERYNLGKQMTSEEKAAFRNNVRAKIYEMKRALPEGEKLVHEDGTAKGKEIIYGVFYKQ